jgi:hypothetical protein
MNISILDPSDDTVEFDRLDFIKDLDAPRVPSLAKKSVLEYLEPKLLEVVSDDNEETMEEEGERQTVLRSHTSFMQGKMNGLSSQKAIHKPNKAGALAKYVKDTDPPSIVEQVFVRRHQTRGSSDTIALLPKLLDPREFTLVLDLDETLVHFDQFND